jgi:tetratricopeptide (TPR) repeat protein
VLILARAALVLSVLVFFRGLLEGFETPKVALVRVLGSGALVCAVASATQFRGRRWHVLDVAAVGWILVEILTTAFSVDPRLSIIGEVEQHEGLLTSLGLAGIYGAIRLGHRDPERAAVTLEFWAWPVAIASGYAILQAVHLDPLQWSGTAAYGAQVTRAFGTLGHPNLFGVVSAATIPVVLFNASVGRARPGLWVAMLGLLALATALTFSRAAWIAGLTGVAVTGSLLWFERAEVRHARRALWTAAGAVLVAIAFLMISPWGVPLRSRFAEIFQPGHVSTRLEIWSTALAAWRARPWLGHGPDTFALVFYRFQTPEYWQVEWGMHAVHAHSIYLHTLATRGVVGMLAGMGWLAGLIAATVGVWRAGGKRRMLAAPLLGSLAAACTAGSLGALGVTGALLVVTSSAMMVALSEEPRLGMAVSSEGGPAASRSDQARPLRFEAALPKKTGAPPARKPRSPSIRLPRHARAVGFLSAIAVLIWSATDLRGSSAALRSQSWVAWAQAQPEPTRNQGLLQAVAWSKRATAANPWDDGLWFQEAEALHIGSPATSSFQRALEEAARAVRRAISLVPLRPRNHQSLGNVLMTLAGTGDTSAIAAGEAAFQRAVELAPLNTLILLDWARGELKLGRTQPALRAARLAAALYPADAKAHAILGSAYLAAGSQDSARAAYGRALAADWHDEDGYVEAHYDFAASLASLGRRQDAIKHFEEAIRLRPAYAEAQNYLGVLLGMEGRLEDALAHLTEAVRLSPDYAAAQNNLGNVNARMGRMDRAIEHWREALRLDPNHAEARHNLEAALAKSAASAGP